MLSLPLEQMDHDVLDLVSGVVLDDSTVRELIAAVDDGREHQTAHLEADRDRLTREIEALVNSIASGVPAATIAPAIREREKALASVDRQLAAPRPAAVNVEALRATLEQRTSDWKADLRREPKVARLVLRRLVGPLKLWTGPEARWEAQPTPERLLDGLIHLDHPRSCLTKMDPISAPLRTHMG